MRRRESPRRRSRHKTSDKYLDHLLGLNLNKPWRERLLREDFSVVGENNLRAKESLMVRLLLFPWRERKNGTGQREYTVSLVRGPRKTPNGGDLVWVAS